MFVVVEGHHDEQVSVASTENPIVMKPPPLSTGPAKQIIYVSLKIAVCSKIYIFFKFLFFRTGSTKNNSIHCISQCTVEVNNNLKKGHCSF